MPDVKSTKNNKMYIYSLAEFAEHVPINSTTKQENEMTTPEATERYEAEHLQSVNGRKVVIFNPNNLPVEELPRIYGFNNGGSLGWYQAIAIAEDGHELGLHVCSTENYMPSDLGVIEGTRDDRHTESYQKHYPSGYVMEFVPFDKVKTHEKLMKAFELAKDLPELPPVPVTTVTLDDGTKIIKYSDGVQATIRPTPTSLVKKVTDLVKNELQWQFKEDDDYGQLVESLKDSFGEERVISRSEPEDAIWDRDLSSIFDCGLKLGVRNAIKVLRENPELLKEAV